MLLEHETLPIFEPFIKEIHKIAFTTGQQYLQREGISNLDELKSKPLVYKPFIRYCHKGYDRAQKIIAKEIIMLYELKKNNEESLKIARNSKKKNEVYSILRLLNVINNRILVLRRIIDAMAFTLLQAKVWIARRFILHNKIRDIDIHAIQTSLLEACSINDKDRLKFALVNDLTTFIDIGDLLEISFRKSPPEWGIIELKSGKINMILTDILEKGQGEIKDKEIDALESTIGKHAPQQIRRMMRQKQRTQNVQQILIENKGIDIQTGEKIILNEEELVTEGYEIVVDKVCEETMEKGFSIYLVDQCLFIIGATNLSSAIHMLYHVKYPHLNCAFKDKLTETIKKEIEAMQQAAKGPFVVDLANHNMYSKSSFPFFLYPFGIETLIDLLFDRLKVILFLDINRFADLCSNNGYKMDFCSINDTNEMAKQYGRRTLPLYENRIIKLTDAEGCEHKLMGGTFHRMFFDLVRPSEILRIYKIAHKEMKEKQDFERGNFHE